MPFGPSCHDLGRVEQLAPLIPAILETHQSCIPARPFCVACTLFGDPVKSQKTLSISRPLAWTSTERQCKQGDSSESKSVRRHAFESVALLVCGQRPEVCFLLPASVSVNIISFQWYPCSPLTPAKAIGVCHRFRLQRRSCRSWNSIKHNSQTPPIGQIIRLPGGQSSTYQTALCGACAQWSGVLVLLNSR